ncbi:DUF2972 domain-containing protein, partial [Campylobacter sp. MIT 97-5078]|uniref:DUF2972 domain-containing protein n=1 Tax=Campylobacter sp. MIT 97-5078 TaxID=1548153 RepID=UPI0011605518
MNAVDRVKNSLSYKLGLKLLEYHNLVGGGGSPLRQINLFLNLLFSLYKLKKAYKKELSLYKKFIIAFPHLKKPKLEQLDDYQQSFSVKRHAAFLYGNALIQADKSFLKFGYFKFFAQISKIKAEVEFYKHVKIELKINFKEFDQKAFSFFDAKKEEILAWINSQEYKQKYLDKKHPYPPLLNPKKIDYLSIDPHIAWLFNIPFPHCYKFIWHHLGSSASIFFGTALRKSETPQMLFTWWNFKQKYIDNLIKYQENPRVDFILIIVHLDEKMRALLDKKTPFIFISRDPVSKLKHAINHISGKYSQNISSFMKRFNLSCKPKELLPKPLFCSNENINDEYPSVLGIYGKTLWIVWEFNSMLEYLENQKEYISEIICIDFADLSFDKAYETWQNLSKKLGLKAIEDEIFFKQRMNKNQGALAHLPTTLYAHRADLKNVFDPDKENHMDLHSLQVRGGFELKIGLRVHFYDAQGVLQEDLKDISFEMLEQNIIIDKSQICIIMKEDEYQELKTHEKLYEASKNYLKHYVKELENEALRIEKILVTEEEILEYLKDDEERLDFFKAHFDKERDVAKHNPKCLDSWHFCDLFDAMYKEAKAK